MKIRQDFVTNSSSVSYIITMHKPTVDALINQDIHLFSDSRKRVIHLLYNDLLEHGTLNMLEKVQIYSKKVEFRTDGDTMNEESYEQPIDQIDFSQMSDSDVWALVYGEYIINQKIVKIDGFGLTKI